MFRNVSRTFLVGLALLLPIRAQAGDAPHAPAKDHYEHDFSDIPRYVKAFEGPKRDAWQKPEEVVNLLQLWPGNTVADVGAGTGYFEPLLSRAVGPAGHVLALDAEPRMVTYLQARVKKEGLSNVTVQRVQPGDPALAEASVDRIVVIDTWHHVPERAKYAAALNRALRPGGFVVIVDFTADSPEGPPAHARLSPATVMAELQAGGLAARIVPESLPLQYAIVGQKRGLAVRRAVPGARQQALINVINANAGHAHFTRGVNTFTIEALQKELKPTDEPELRALLGHEDTVVVRTAASVFAARGDAGLAVLREAAVDPALPEGNRTVLDDVIWTDNARRKHPQ